MVKGKSESKKIKELEKQLAQVAENWKRALADYQNLVRRTEKERNKVYYEVKKDLVLKFLPILDLLENAMVHTDDEGTDLMAREFYKILEQEGVKAIKIDGKKFDPEIMDCIEVVEGREEGRVAEVVLAGYKMDDEIIRQAKVKVFKNKG